jgi:hypothetical protein
MDVLAGLASFKLAWQDERKKRKMFKMQSK